MRSKKGRSQLKTNKTQITFQDVRACFTSDESQLLHNWKKELFQKVMKEIHQALLSLGPVIAASVFSLSTEEIEDLCFNNNEECERRCRDNHSPVHDEISVILSASIKEEEDYDLTDHEEPTEIQNFNYPKDGIHTSYNVGPGDVMSVRIKEEEETYPVAPQDHAEAQNTPCATGLPPLPSELEAWHMDHMEVEVDEDDASGSPGIPVVTASFSLLTDEVTELRPMDQEGSEEGESSDCPLGVPVVTASFSLTTDDTFELQPLDHEDSVERASSHCPSGDGSMNIETDIGEMIKRAKAREKEKSTLAASLEENHKALPQMSPEGPDHICALRLDRYHESPAEGGAQCESTLDNPEHFSIQQVHYSVNTTLTYDSESHPLFLSSLEDADQNETVYTCTECGQCFFMETDFVEHMKKHTRVRAFPCTMCEKSFYTKTQLRGHYKIHTGEKPHICTFCQKGFRRKDHLNGHVRTHTGEKPYRCTKCEQGFRCKTNLNSHRRIHHQPRQDLCE